MTGSRWLRLVTVIAAVMAFFIGAHADGPACALVTVDFWHAAGGEHGQVLESLVDEFNASRDDIRIVPSFQGDYDALMQKLTASVAAKDPPALALTYNNWTSLFVQGGAIVPMERFVNDTEVGFTADEIADFHGPLLDANRWDGVLYTLPFNKSVQVLYYNKDLLDAAGVGVPSTLDELSTAARTVFDRTGVPGLAVNPSIDTFTAYFRTFGGEWLDARGRPAFHGEAGVRALEFVMDLVKDGAAYVSDAYLDDELNRGKVAMFIHSNGTIPWVRRGATFAWGTAPVPVGSVPASTVAGLDLAIFAQADPDEQWGAWEFVKWILSPEVNARWSVATGYLPVRKSAVESLQVQSYLAMAPHEIASGIQSLERMVFDPGIPAWNDMRNFVSEAVAEVLLLGADPYSALREAALRSERAMLDDQ